MRDGHDVSWAMDALIDNAMRRGRGFVWARARRGVVRGEKAIARVSAVNMTKLDHFTRSR